MPVTSYPKLKRAYPMIKTCLAFLFFSCTLSGQTIKGNAFLFIELQGPNYVEHEFRIYLAKDSIEYRTSQSGDDFIRKGKLKKKACENILNKAVPLIESLRIDPTKETGLHSSHFFRLSLSLNKQSKSIYIGDKYYYTFLEDIFKTINTNVENAFKIPLDSISFPPGDTTKNKNNYNAFGIEWAHTFFKHPKNQSIYHNDNYGDTLKITNRTTHEEINGRKIAIEKTELDSLRVLTERCAGYFRFDTEPLRKSDKYELFEVYQQTAAIGIYTTLGAFETIEKHDPFKRLKSYLNGTILKTQPLE